MAYTNLGTTLPAFDRWVDLRPVATPANNTPAIFTIQDGKSVKFLTCDYKRNQGTVVVNSLAILNADKSQYEWQNI